MSRTYDVYGIGNALVDIQYQVDPAFLEDKDIVKGVMTLIEEDRQKDLIVSLTDNALERSSGGSAANTMISVASCGGKAYYACKIAHDEDGDFYLSDLQAAGVASNPSNREEGITGKCLVMITPDADRTMNTFLGITSTFGPEQVDEAVIGDSTYLYIEGYLVASDMGFEAARMAQKLAQANGTRVSLTLSDPFIVDLFKDRMVALVDAGVDMLFCNDDEAQMFTGTSSVQDACEALAGRVGGFAVTCGAEGARVKGSGDLFQASGFQVEAVDTNGAGDSFAGAFLFGVTNGYSVEQSAKLATYVSSRVVSKYGPRFEDRLDRKGIEAILEM